MYYACCLDCAWRDDGAFQGLTLSAADDAAQSHSNDTDHRHTAGWLPLSAPPVR